MLWEGEGGRGREGGREGEGERERGREREGEGGRGREREGEGGRERDTLINIHSEHRIQIHSFEG